MRIKDARTGKQVPAPEDELPDTEELDVTDDATEDDTDDLAELEAEVKAEADDDDNDAADPPDDPDELDPTDETEEPGDAGDDAGAFELVPPRDPLKELVEHDGPLLFDARSYQERWNSIQIGFVDEPHYAVESAGRLLAEVLGEVASTFASKRKDLESQWRHDREISTEELRLAFRGYRAFFQRVIAL